MNLKYARYVIGNKYTMEDFMKTLFLILLMALAFNVISCGGDEEPGEQKMTKEGFMEKVEGKYAHYDIVAYYGEMPEVAGGGTFKNLIISYGFTSYRVEDGKLITTDRFCFAEQETNQPMKSIMRDEAAQAIIPDDVEMEINIDDSGNFYIHRPETPTLIGIEYLNKSWDPYTTPLPETYDENNVDYRQVDADNDGEIGCSIDIEGANEMTSGTLFIARREIFKYNAFLQEDGKIIGEVSDRSEQLILDASNPILTADIPFFQYEDLTKSPIILVPIDGDWDCDKLKAERDNLFPTNPTVWED